MRCAGCASTPRSGSRTNVVLKLETCSACALLAIAERMTAGASRRGRLVVTEPRVARHAGRAIVTWLQLVPGVAARARRMTGVAVQPGARAVLVTRHARRCLRRAVRAMSLVTARACDALAVTRRCLAGVAARARRRRNALAVVRIVARRADEVTLRSRRRLRRMTARARSGRERRRVRTAGVAVHAGAVTGANARGHGCVTRRARRPRRRGFVRRLRVTADALGVTCRRRRRRLLRVALRAERRGELLPGCMRRVAVGARRIRVVRFLVAALARDGLLARGEPVRGMAARARTIVVRHLLAGVAARTRLRRCALVRLMTRGARRVLRGDEHGLVRVTARACGDGLHAELVRRVTARALRVARRQSTRVDL